MVDRASPTPRTPLDADADFSAEGASVAPAQRPPQTGQAGEKVSLEQPDEEASGRRKFQAVRPVTRWIWAAIGLHAFMAIVMFDQIEEDAFIYFRVARNIALGNGYVFNAGGEHVECGSSVTWQFLLAFLDLFWSNLIFISKFTGVALGCGTMYLLGRISARFVSSSWLQIAPSLLLALSIPFYYWEQRGLETSLYAFSIVLLAHFLLDDRLKRWWYLPALLVALSRSEGFIVLAGLPAFFWFERKRLRNVLVGLGIFVAVLVLVEIGRIFYFHDLVPHAFYLKMREPRGLARAAVEFFFRITNLWIVLGVAAVGLLRRAAWNRSLAILACLEMPFMAWALNTHALAMNNRHLVPALALLYFFVAYGLDQIVQKVPALIHPIVWGFGLFFLWFAIECPAVDLTIQPLPNPFRSAWVRAEEKPDRFFSNLKDLVLGRRRAVSYMENYLSDSITENWQYQVGDFINRTYPKGITVMYDQMGQTPWYGGMDKTFIDTTGLTYRPTAFLILNHALDNSGEDDAFYLFYRKVSDKLLRVFNEPYRNWRRKDAVDHLLAMNPELIIVSAIYVIRTLPDGKEELITEHVPGMLFADPRLRERYVERKKYFLRFFERKDMSARINWDPKGRHFPGVPPAEASH